MRLLRWHGSKEFACNAGDSRDLGLIPGLRRFPGEGNGNPLQYSCLGNSWTEEPGGLQSIGPGIEPVCLVLADGFFTTEPSGKPSLILTYSFLVGLISVLVVCQHPCLQLL